LTGLEEPSSNSVVTSQKCVRAGGKHNDLDHVGYTARHHTFFEMLGNFSFGDYFKEEAICFAWDLLIKEFGLKQENLLVTVYHDDDDSAFYWKKIAGFSEHKIIRISSNDNFWSMGDTGPCGPCSEIFYDHGSDIPGGLPGTCHEKGDRFIEIWNLVFMQYKQVSSSERLPLSRPSVDTGMGLERIAAVLQGVHDNYDIDFFRSLICALEDATGVKAEGEFRASHRVIADHMRASAFLIADGLLPSNEGRGYVLRRIMRRAMRHAHLLGVKEPLLWKIVSALIQAIDGAYPELIEAESLIVDTLKFEEARFRKMLDRGLNLLENVVRDIGYGGYLDGDIAFKLYDTYGFPLDLTQDALRSRGVFVDVAGFDRAMQGQKEAAKAIRVNAQGGEMLWLNAVGRTDFVGYELEEAKAIVLAHREDDPCGLVTNCTPFYAEGGGQIGDSGFIVCDGFVFEVLDTKKLDGVFVHIGNVKIGRINNGQSVDMRVDSARRAHVRMNHSATHLLHEGLRRILGHHVLQQGSLVTHERLRFDFSHPRAVTKEELSQIEDLANSIVLQNNKVITRIMTLDNALAEGALALFEEKYDDDVRVVSIGGSTPWSIELCGGLHVQRTGDIGLIHIISEGAVAAGVRRIEALTGNIARHYLLKQKGHLYDIAEILKSTPHGACSRISTLMEERSRLQKNLKEAHYDLSFSSRNLSILSTENTKLINGIAFTVYIVSGIPPRELKSLADAGKKKIVSGVFVLITLDKDGKASLVVGVTDDLLIKISAIELVRLGSSIFGGKGGGGRPDMAQSGGPYGAHAKKAIDAIRRRLECLSMVGSYEVECNL
jgi:alanyl-tRNA synthetase